LAQGGWQVARPERATAPSPGLHISAAADATHVRLSVPRKDGRGFVVHHLVGPALDRGGAVKSPRRAFEIATGELEEEPIDLARFQRELEKEPIDLARVQRAALRQILRGQPRSESMIYALAAIGARKEIAAQRGYPARGIHPMSFDAFTRRFGTNQRRLQMIDDLKSLLRRARALGVSEVYVTGSFLSNKEEPGDVDVFMDEAWKRHFSLELFMEGLAKHVQLTVPNESTRRGPNTDLARGRLSLFYSRDRRRVRRGYVRLDLAEL
jgi:hypothetical protein